jgi:hypothetical protein
MTDPRIDVPDDDEEVEDGAEQDERPEQPVIDPEVDEE